MWAPGAMAPLWMLRRLERFGVLDMQGLLVGQERVLSARRPESAREDLPGWTPVPGRAWSLHQRQCATTSALAPPKASPAPREPTRSVLKMDS